MKNQRDLEAHVKPVVYLHEGARNRNVNQNQERARIIHIYVYIYIDSTSASTATIALVCASGEAILGTLNYFP